MIPIVCTLLVTADVHGSLSRMTTLAEALAEEPVGDSWVAHLGDFVESPDQWGRWDRAFDDLDVVGAMGNHDDPEGFLRRFRPVYRSICGDVGSPGFVTFTVDPYGESGDSAGDDGLVWARREYPDTPWVVLAHRPVAPCSTRYQGHELAWRRRLEPLLPAGSIVVSGHEHVFCIHRGLGYTQIIASTGGGKRYECASLNGVSVCEELPAYPTYLRISPLADELEQVVVRPEGVERRTWSIMAGPEE